MPPRAVLFDFDGVLANTENIHVAAWERVFGLMGWDVLPEICARAGSVDDRDFLAGLFQERGIEMGDVPGWVARKQELTVQMLRDNPRLNIGIDRLVLELGSRTRLAIVSTTWRENIDAALDRAGLRDRFELIVAKQDVSTVKPDPEAYRTALRALKLSSGSVVAIEDSPTGFQAARSAGIRTVVYAPRGCTGDWANGAPVLTSLKDRTNALRVLGFE